MMPLRVRTRVLTGVAAVAALLSVALIPGAAAVRTAASAPCGPSTQTATLRPRADGTLACAPGEQPILREDLATADPARALTRQALLSFFALSDPTFTDEESPLRTEFLDACGTSSFAEAFRPHESMIPAVLNSHVKAANALSATGSPVLRKNYDFAVALGNTTDNGQRNELDAFFELLRGATAFDPDSGTDGYQGIQGTDPVGGNPRLSSPVAGSSMRALANEPFEAPGLRSMGGPMPWYGIVGARDARTWGTAPDDRNWRSFAETWATGALKLGTLGTQHQQRVCEDPSVLSDPDFWTAVAADPGTTSVVATDAARAPLGREAFIDAHQPPGQHAHGFVDRCGDADGEPLARGCYSWDQGLFHFVALDTTPATGSDASIDAAQLAWLEQDLMANAARFVSAGGKQKQTENPTRVTVVLQSHPTAELEGALEEVLLRFPNVVLQLTAGSRHRVIPHTTKGGGYWEVQTAPLVDWPSQSRSIEIADNGDGTLSIFSVMVDAATPPDARALSWSADDPTDERASSGAQRAINEDWLASAAREIALNDPQADAAATGRAKDRNVELIVTSPLGVREGPGSIVPTIPTLPTGPPFAPGFPTGGFLPGFPDGTGYPQQQTPPPFPTITPPQTFLTGPGLAVRPGAGGSLEARATPFLVIAAAGALWLTRARVRRWMVGI